MNEGVIMLGLLMWAAWEHSVFWIVVLFICALAD